MSDPIPLPTDLEAERDALIAEIHAAFDGVTREGGISWSEASVIDDYGSDAERAEARQSDKDSTWVDLAYDETWNCGPAIGGWNFLDEIGFRYYLPAAMVRHVTAGGGAYITFSLPESLAWFDEERSLLNDRQRACVARFLRYWIARYEALAREDTCYAPAESICDDERQLYQERWQRYE